MALPPPASQTPPSLPHLPPSPLLALDPPGPEPPARCEGLDGDNWPMTWAADGWLYAAYGDGWGCRPLDPATKRNTGLVRLRGAPSPAPRAEEVPCPHFGAGAQPPNIKGCGLLSAAGTLYHFLRHQVDGPPGQGRRQVASKLIVSRDAGRTWSGGDYAADPDAMAWFFREPDAAFHSPTFLQAGQAYGEAPDRYAYVYSPREPRRLAADRLDLARAPLDAVADRGAYEFHAGAGRWTRDPAERQPALDLPDHVNCGDVLYVAALDRCIVATCWAREGAASRLLLLDAPRPWGPWTLCGAIAPWGTGSEGDSRYDPRIPACWVEVDASGVDLVLVYSDRRRPSDKLNWQPLHLRRRGEAGV